MDTFFYTQTLFLGLIISWLTCDHRISIFDDIICASGILVTVFSLVKIFLSIIL